MMLLKEEEALRQSDKQYQKLVDTSLVGFCKFSLGGNFLYVNPSYWEVMEYNSLEEFNAIPMSAHFKNPNEQEKVIDDLKKTGKITNQYVEILSKTGKTKHLLVNALLEGDVISVMYVDVTDLKNAEEALHKAHLELEQRVEERTAELSQANKELEIKTSKFEEANTALKVVMKVMDEEKVELEEKILYNVKELVHPFLKKLQQSNLDQRQTTFLEIVESNLRNVISPFSHRLSSKLLGLTSTEIQVANLIKEGKNTKNIAALLDLSSRTVESHRNNIRRKLELKNKKANLRTHLLSIQ